MNRMNFYEEMKNFVEKAIGTSSSIDQPRDERNIEFYARDGGDIMTNTTEPDPQGNIAVTKVIDQMTRPTNDVSVSDAPNNPAVVPDQATMDSSATSAIAPTSEEMAEATEENIEKAANCPSCGQAMPVEKAASCSDCGKSMDLCDCMSKVADEPESKEEAAKETPADEKAEMKKSIWGGAFAPAKL